MENRLHQSPAHQSTQSTQSTHSAQSHPDSQSHPLQSNAATALKEPGGLLSSRSMREQARRHSYPIIVHSHLRWDWVWQRPQQFLSRLSKNHKILFIEEPSASDEIVHSRSRIRSLPDYPNIYVLQCEIPALHWDKRRWVDSERRRILQSVLAGPLGNDFESPVQWFYDPMAVTAFAGQMNETAIVYDCMDQLSQFRNAPRELVLRERELLTVADVVFAGGPKIQREKAPYNPNCHSFGCGVDIHHFGQARDGRAVIPEDIAHLQGPVLGFFGVVDERMDYDLVAKLADSDPSWNLVIVGPRTKVEASALPQRENIHWLGAREYAQLPHYARRFDVCLMPFAINEATEFINPTKALEYMATGRPVVSSAIEDVVLQFNHVASVAFSHEEFIGHCRNALREPNQSRLQSGIELAQQNSWESIVNQLESHIANVLGADHGVWEGEVAGC